MMEACSVCRRRVLDAGMGARAGAGMGAERGRLRGNMVLSGRQGNQIWRGHN